MPVRSLYCCCSAAAVPIHCFSWIVVRLDTASRRVYVLRARSFASLSWHQRCASGSPLTWCSAGTTRRASDRAIHPRFETCFSGQMGARAVKNKKVCFGRFRRTAERADASPWRRAFYSEMFFWTRRNVPVGPGAVGHQCSESPVSSLGHQYRFWVTSVADHS